MSLDLIEPTEEAAWVAPVHVVFKEGKEPRLCVDFRQLNEHTEDDRFPLPHIDDVLDSLVGSTVFSKLDLKKGYWQIWLSEEAAKMCNFCTQKGIYRWKRMPFGLKGAPSTF